MFSDQNHKSPSRTRATFLVLAAYASGAGIGAITAIIPPPAYAATAETPRTKVVHYADLDLASEQGTAKLQQRIHRAAKQVCELNGVLAVMQRRVVRDCIDKAHADAWAIAKQKIGNTDWLFGQTINDLHEATPGRQNP